MKNKFLSTIPGIVFILFIVYYFIDITGVQKVISWDVLGYYLYLPSTFLYDDLSLDKYELYDQLIKQYDLSGTFYQINKTTTGHFINKYSMGMAIIYAPFYFIGDLIASLTEYPRDGFSMPYQLSLQIGGFIYTVLSVLLVFKLLSKFYNQVVVTIVTAAFFFGTNYFLSATVGNSMPHNMLFLFYGIIIWQTIEWHKTFQTKNIIYLGIASGILILARPTELLALFIPLFWNVTSIASFKGKLQLLKSFKTQLLLFIIILFCFGIPQFVYWKILAGKWLVIDYGNAAEGFDFFIIKFLGFLLSFRNGWFIYTPIMLVATFGFYFLKKRNPKLFTPFFIFFILNLYVVCISSSWWYADSFSCKDLIQSSIIMLFPLSELVSFMIDKKKKTLIISILSVFVLLNLFQTWQFNKGIIHKSRMTMASYFKAFGTFKLNKKNDHLLLVERDTNESGDMLPDPDELLLTQRLIYDFEDLENPDESNKASAYKGVLGDYVNDKKSFSKAVRIPFSRITEKKHAWIEVDLKIKPTYDFKAEPFSIVTLSSHNGENYKYRGLNSEELDLKVNEWNSVKQFYLTPVVKAEDDEFVFYIWNRGKQLVRIDQVEVKIYENK